MSGEAGHEAGKGDTPRPMVDRKQFESNWETIFRNVEPVKELLDDKHTKHKETND